MWLLRIDFVPPVCRSNSRDGKPIQVRWCLARHVKLARIGSGATSALIAHPLHGNAAPLRSLPGWPADTESTGSLLSPDTSADPQRGSASPARPGSRERERLTASGRSPAQPWVQPFHTSQRPRTPPVSATAGGARVPQSTGTELPPAWGQSQPCCVAARFWRRALLCGGCPWTGKMSRSYAPAAIWDFPAWSHKLKPPHVGAIEGDGMGQWVHHAQFSFADGNGIGPRRGNHHVCHLTLRWSGCSVSGLASR
jgi:hypothetical protein